MSKNNIKVVLAFDFGMKRIGVAVGQTVTLSARPLETLIAKNGQPDWMKVDQIVNYWAPNAFIVGIPLNMDGTRQSISDDASQFCQKLKTRYHLPVHEVDERLTTKDAREQLFRRGGYKALQDGQVDQVAAQLILQNWLSDNFK